MISLKPPLVLGPDDYAKKYIQVSRDLNKVYHPGYPHMDNEGFGEIDAHNIKEREARIKKSPQLIYYKHEDSKKEMSFIQCFTLCRIYNINLYIHNKQCVVHFKDVISVLSKIVIENKHKVENDISYESPTIETMLMDRWVSTYPSRLLLSVLATLTEQTTIKKYDDHGNRLKPFDILFYQAATVLSKIWRKNKEMNEVVAQMNNQQNQKLMAYREFEEDTNNKLGYFEKINMAFFTQKAFQEMLSTSKKNSETKKTPKVRTKELTMEPKSSSTLQYDKSVNSLSPSVTQKKLVQVQKDVFKSRLFII